MISGLREPVRAGAVFEGGWPKPVWFDYKGRKISVKNIFYRWKEKSGSFHIIKFSLSDGGTIYEIEFNPLDMAWFLTAFGEEGDGFAVF